MDRIGLALDATWRRCHATKLPRFGSFVLENGYEDLRMEAAAIAEHDLSVDVGSMRDLFARRKAELNHFSYCRIAWCPAPANVTT